MNDRTDVEFPFHPARRALRIVGLVILGVLAAAAFALAFGWFVMLLWNWLMPAIFGLGAITYWQAFGLVVLAKLIFGAVGGGRGGHHDRRWRYWREFWEQEGREAFDRFIQRRQAPGQEKSEGPADTQG